MELWEEILCRLVQKESKALSRELLPLLEKTCYRALQEIKEVIEDDTLDDQACFERIEKIVCIFEHLGSTGGGRHDFG